ncbi:hypothetical protein Strain138_002493 [Pseudogemmatithrix spongiicola]|uniref:Uncharacterized protein n=1 Tax=Pseudogemmatithrix spongiicola TaxID=3062599 RepID=A0AA49JW70_9BACT|nr:hypothetical protein Strain138_002493 [Gemmatimonadaceae bacterium 'strain 138']WKW16084.1 hypothetical protein Strain318_002493 [Gemmatimonadaceae bacterium 'strain 318']
MSFTTGLNIVIILCAAGVFVQSFRIEPESRGKLRLLSLGFLLMGVSDFLKPVSEALALGVEAAGLLIFLWVGVRALIAPQPAKPQG